MIPKGGKSVKMFEHDGSDYRHEYKYVIGLDKAVELSQKLHGLMHFDKHSDAGGRYLISSVYFDSADDSDLFSSQSGAEKRRKYRIRAYNHDDSFISMEIKEKNRYLCQKRSLTINRKIYDEILYGDCSVLKSLNNEVADEFYYKIKVEGYAPKTVVEYVRRAFIYDVSNVRITLDGEIKGSSCGADMFKDTHSLVPTFSPLANVLEVKFDKFLPYHLKAALPQELMPRQSVSKYVYGRMYI